MSDVLQYPITLVPGRLAFMSGAPRHMRLYDADHERALGKVTCVSSKMHEDYAPLAGDFGPVNIGVVYRFCKAFGKRLDDNPQRLLVYCIPETFEARANSSFLLGSLLILHVNWTPTMAAQPFTGPDCPFSIRPFRDATLCEPVHVLTLTECLRGLHRSVQAAWFDINTFDPLSYADLDSPYGGDIHEICPKFVAFKSPLSRDSEYLQSKETAFPPEDYAPILLDLGVTCVIRLNEQDAYDKREFERAGIAHHDLYFDDCTVPSDSIVERFFDICDREERVAVHCRAGLGRTGTLIALWLMRHGGFEAGEAVGWLRIVRPGCVIGPQQRFLQSFEGRGWRVNAPEPVPGQAPSPLDRSLRSQQCFLQLGIESPPVDAVELDAADLASQVTAGMCARAAAKAAAAKTARAAAKGIHRSVTAGGSALPRATAGGSIFPPILPRGARAPAYGSLLSHARHPKLSSARAPGQGGCEGH